MKLFNRINYVYLVLYIFIKRFEHCSSHRKTEMSTQFVLCLSVDYSIKLPLTIS